MGLDEDFKKAVKGVSQFVNVKSQVILVEFYAMEQQGSVGDVCGPMGTDTKSKARYCAWAKMKGTSKEEAQRMYVKMYDELKGTYTAKQGWLAWIGSYFGF